MRPRCFLCFGQPASCSMSRGRACYEFFLQRPLLVVASAGTVVRECGSSRDSMRQVYANFVGIEAARYGAHYGAHRLRVARKEPVLQGVSNFLIVITWFMGRCKQVRKSVDRLQTFPPLRLLSSSPHDFAAHAHLRSISPTGPRH